jgi:hypothetical protein
MRPNPTLFFLAAVLLATTLGAQSESETFLDRRRSEAERMSAASQILHPDEKRSEAFLGVAADRRESDAIRFEAFRRHRFDDKWLALALKVLDAPNDGGAMLDSNLSDELNRRLTFRLPAEVRQRIRATWRRLLDDPRDEVRLSAFRVLVANHDPVAVNRLSESLRRRTRSPIPLHEALDLLELDGSINHLTALRPYLDHSDPRVRAVAARALAVDSASRPRIIELATNPEESGDVRADALRGLSREDPKFGSYAIPIVENEQEHGDVRYAAMHSFVGRMNYNRVEPQEQVRFAQAVEKIAVGPSLRSDSAEQIRKEARELLENLKMAFPAVHQFYAPR